MGQASSLEGTVAQQPMIIGNMQVGFYSAYYTDVTPISLVDLDGKAIHSMQYTATHQNMLIMGPSHWVLKYEMSPISVVYTQ
jgi:hypothetical protein